MNSAREPQNAGEKISPRFASGSHRQGHDAMKIKIHRVNRVSRR